MQIPMYIDLELCAVGCIDLQLYVSHIIMRDHQTVANLVHKQQFSDE